MVFSSAKVNVPPGAVGPLLHEFGLVWHSAKPGEYCGVLFTVDCLEQAEASKTTAAIAARPVSLFDAGMSPPVGVTAHAARRTGSAGTESQAVVPKGNAVRRHRAKGRPPF